MPRVSLRTRRLPPRPDAPGAAQTPRHLAPESFHREPSTCFIHHRLSPTNRSPSGTVGPAVVLRKDKHAALARRPCWLSTMALTCPRRYGRGRNQVGVNFAPVFLSHKVACSRTLLTRAMPPAGLHNQSRTRPARCACFIKQEHGTDSARLQPQYSRQILVCRQSQILNTSGKQQRSRTCTT
jgi:hypothetical protein